MENKKGWLIAFACVIALAVIYFWGKRKIETLQPEVTLTAIAINEINSDSIGMTSKLQFVNPLPTTINAKRIEYTVEIGGSKIMSGVSEQPLKLASREQASISLPMNLYLEPLSRVMEKMENRDRDSISYTLNGSAYFEIPLVGTRRFDFTRKSLMPPFRLLEIKSADINIDRLRWKATNLDVALTVDNSNSFPVKMKNADYDISLDKEHMLNGTIDGVVYIPPKSTKVIPIDVELKNKAIGKLISTTLFKKGEVPMTIDFNARLVSENEMLDNSQIAMQTNGTIKDFKDLMKKVKEIKD